MSEKPAGKIREEEPTGRRIRMICFKSEEQVAEAGSSTVRSIGGLCFDDAMSHSFWSHSQTPTTAVSILT